MNSTGLHWKIYFFPVLILCIGGFIYLNESLDSSLLFLVVGGIWFIYSAIKDSTTKIVLSSKELQFKSGVFNTQNLTVPLDSLEAIDIQQGILGKIFKYGDFKYGNGAASITFPNVKYPVKFRKSIIDTKFNNSNVGQNQYVRTTDTDKLESAERNGSTGFTDSRFNLNGLDIHEDVLSTQYGNFKILSSGVFIDEVNSLMWVRGFWGMNWDGKEFTGSTIKLGWNKASKLFGRSKKLSRNGISSFADLRNRIISKNQAQFIPGNCKVHFAGYSDWRLPRAYELQSLNFYDREVTTQIDSPVDYFELREKLIPSSEKNRGIWTSDVCSWDLAWGANGSFSIGDDPKQNDYNILFVRNI